MKCTQCTAELIADALFCHHCGQRLATAPAADNRRENFQDLLASRADDDLPERELWQGKYSQRAMIGSWIGAAGCSVLLLLVAALNGFTGKGWGFSVVLIVSVWVGLLLRLFYRQLAEHYYLTDRRFVHERGIL